MDSSSPAFRQSPILPPRGLLLALTAQLPLIADAWPLHPGTMEVLAGALLLLAGLCLNLWSARLFESAAVGIRPFSPAAVLVRHGPYGYSRNPMYLGLVAISLGLTVLTGTLANLWISVALGGWLHHAYVLPEENFLRERFGSAWDEYSQQVPRWLPPIR